MPQHLYNPHTAKKIIAFNTGYERHIICFIFIYISFQVGELVAHRICVCQIIHIHGIICFHGKRIILSDKFLLICYITEKKRLCVGCISTVSFISPSHFLTARLIALSISPLYTASPFSLRSICFESSLHLFTT